MYLAPFFYVKEGVYKCVCIKFLQVIDTFAYSDVFYWYVKLRLDRYCDSALGCTIKFGKNDSGNVCDLGKLSCLGKRILARGSVKNYQRF